MKHTHLLHTQMIEAIEAQDLPKVRDLIANGVKVNYINNSCASSAIEAAANVGNVEIVKFLIESKADPNKWYMRSPLVIAIDKEFVDIANLLIHAGADVNTDPEFDLTPLMRAASLNDFQLVKKLIDAGADVNAWGKESNPPLSIAACRAYNEIYEYILPLVDPSYLDRFLDEGLLIAIIEDSIVGIEFLASVNVNLNCRDFNGETALIYAIKNGHFSSAKRLIELGADIL
jgi:ankyrin repeat protein